jgi:hypothetical protein
MSAVFQCNSCGFNRKVKAELLGKRAKCPDCSMAVTVTRRSEMSYAAIDKAPKVVSKKLDKLQNCMDYIGEKVISVRQETKKKQGKLIQRQNKSKINDQRTETEKISKAHDNIAYIFHIIIYFPIFLMEKISKKKISTRIAYAVLALFSFIGLYDLVYGGIGSVFYDKMIEFSDQSLVNSMTVLSATKIGEFIAKFYNPALAEILDNLSDIIAKGVLSLGLQSAILRIIQAGFLFKYVLGFGFLLCILKPFEKFGQKIVVMSFIIYFIMPAIVFTEASIYNHYSSSLSKDIKRHKEEIGSVFGVTQDIAAETYYGAMSSINSWLGNDEKAQEFDRLREEKTEVFDRVKALAMAILECFLFLLLLIVFTCILAPILAYFLIFKYITSLIRKENSNFYYKICHPVLES